MRTKEIIASIAVVGAVAAIALFNINSQPAQSFLAATQNSPLEQAFIKFISKHGRTYGTKEEYSFRLGVFTQNYNKVMRHNSKNAQTEGYVMEVNHFTDMTEAEFKKMLGFAGEKDATKTLSLDTSVTATSVDWRTKGAVNSIKDQG